MKTAIVRSAGQRARSLLVLVFVAMLTVSCGSPATPAAPAQSSSSAPAAPTAQAAPTTVPPTTAPATASAQTALAPTSAAPTAAAPTATASAGSGATISFASDIQPLLNRSCLRCHAGSGSGGLSLDSYAALIKGGNSGAAVTPGKAAQSSLVTLVEQGRMPRGGTKLPQAEIDLLRDWVNEGALDN